MNVMDELIPLIDNGGTRTGLERRNQDEPEKSPDRRTRRDRRSGADRRRVVNTKRKKGVERRTVFSQSEQSES